MLVVGVQEQVEAGGLLAVVRDRIASVGAIVAAVGLRQNALGFDDAIFISGLSGRRSDLVLVKSSLTFVREPVAFIRGAFTLVWIETIHHGRQFGVSLTCAHPAPLQAEPYIGAG